MKENDDILRGPLWSIEEIKRFENSKPKDPLKKEFTNDSPENVSKGAIKYDGGKAPIYRGFVAYFPRAMEGIATVSAFGAAKYAWKGWEGVDDGFNRYTDAMVRHLNEEGKGEILDPDSRLLHAEHTAWNACARLEILKKQLERENEDTADTDVHSTV